MNRALVDTIADAVLYEGYILYPYRPSTKNQRRWTFGGLFPEGDGRGEPWYQETQCLVCGSVDTTVEVAARFLHLTDRQVGALEPPLAAWPSSGEPAWRRVAMLRVGDADVHAWQEAEEREIAVGPSCLGDLCASSLSQAFRFEAGRLLKSLQGPGGKLAGVLVRERHALEGTVQVAACEVESGLFRLTVRIANQTPSASSLAGSRDDSALLSLASTHAILGVDRGEFVSLIDPPDRHRQAATACRNVGAWPVLVGEEGERTMMLAAPIILYDYPQVAPESPGDLFDGAEIDEILTLRILTLTDEEKAAVTALDERAAALLARTEALAREQLMSLHGTFRGLREHGFGGGP